MLQEKLPSRPEAAVDQPQKEVPFRYTAPATARPRTAPASRSKVETFPRRKFDPFIFLLYLLLVAGFGLIGGIIYFILSAPPLPLTP